MALQMSRVTETAEALALIANRMTDLLADANQFLEFNSDQAINWSLSNAKTFTAANATETFTATAHGFANGTKVRVSSTLTLPAGLLAGTDYWVIGQTANTFQLSATKGGAVLPITTDGTGTMTVSEEPEYIDQETNGNLSQQKYSRQAVSNAIGSLDQFRKLMTNLVPSQGDHLGNLNLIGKPLGQ